MSNYPDRGPETLQKYFAGAKFIFLSVAEKICGSPLPEHENFSKLLCRPCERRLTNYRSVIVTSRKQGSLHATQKLKRHYEAIIFSLPQIPAAQFTDTHFHVTSSNHGSFSKQEREPRERGCWLRVQKEKNAERVKPSCTAHFDILAFVILTREMISLEGGGVVSWPKSVNLLRDPGSKKHTS